MSHFSWKDKTLTISSGLSIVTRNPISYQYFKDHFAHTIEFLQNATLTFSYEYEPGLADMRFSYYQNFIDTYKKKLNLPTQQAQLTHVKNSVTVSLMVVILEHYKRKLQQNRDILKPFDTSTDKDAEAFLARNRRNQKELYDKHLAYFSHTKIDQYTFKYKKDFQKLQQSAKTKRGHIHVKWLSDSIKTNDTTTIASIFPGINIKGITHKEAENQNFIWEYLLFNLVFLEQRYAFFTSGEMIELENEYLSDWLLLDNKTLEELHSRGNSGTIINCSLPFSLFNNFIDRKANFETIKTEIQKEYNKFSHKETVQKSRLQKLTHHIEKQLATFSNPNFLVISKDRIIETVTDIVTETDSKRFYEASIKLGGFDKETTKKQGKRQIRTFEKKRKIDDLL